MGVSFTMQLSNPQSRASSVTIMALMVWPYHGTHGVTITDLTGDQHGTHSVTITELTV